MKTFKLIAILIVFFFTSCKSQTKDANKKFEVSIDTINIHIKDKDNLDIKANLTHAIKFKNKYYCYFEEKRKDNYSRETKLFFIISEDGTIEHTINVPEEINNSVYFDLFLRNDSVFTKAYMDKGTFFLDLNKLQWKKIKEVDDMIYEDDKFYITYLDFGEWGNTTWFKEKKTSKEYELASAGTIINKIDNNYFITSGVEILMIEDPLKMKPCDPEYYYNIVVKDKNYHYEGSNSLLGTKILYFDSTYSRWDFKEPKNYIATSFVYNNQLFHLCIDSNSTYIAKLNNGKLIPIQTIGKSYSIFNWHYSYRCKIQKDNSQLLKFESANKNEFGFIEINGNKINIRYLKQ